MKTKRFIITFILLLSFQLQAQKVVALHSASGIQFFSDDNALQTAYASAVDNDTIYLPGGSFTPPTKFEKKLRIIGAGHNPSATTATFMTKISGNFILSDEADGFYLEGVEITNNIYFDMNESINDVVIKRCKMNGLGIDGDRTTPSENCVFQENIMGGVNAKNLLNSTFFNNIIQNPVNEARNIIFLNNLFMQIDCAGYTHTPAVGYANGCMFKNNIFLQGGCGNVVGGNGQSTYSHNIFCTNLSTIILGLDPIVDNNYSMNRDDIFINYTGGDFDYAQDYHLTVAAQANLGDDGTECGIYGGFYPWKEESIPSTPHIISKNISNTSDANGMIHIDINVQAQDR